MQTTLRYSHKVTVSFLTKRKSFTLSMDEKFQKKGFVFEAFEFKRFEPDVKGNRMEIICHFRNVFAN